MAAAGRFVAAAEPRTEHTFELSKGETRPRATLDDAAFLVGSWSGKAFGSRFEQVWNPPSAGTMVGVFKLFDLDEVSFYEILLLSIDDEGTLSLKVKHFNADFTAWEDKDEFINFRLVRKDANALHFGGISFYQRSEDFIEAYIVMRNSEGVRERYLEYHRVH